MAQASKSPQQKNLRTLISSPHLLIHRENRSQFIIAILIIVIVGILATIAVRAAGGRQKISLAFTNTSGNVVLQSDGSYAFTAPSAPSTNHNFSAFDNVSQARFRAYQDIPASQLPASGTVLTDRKFGYNTPNNVEGQFRVACQYSHFNQDDPIVYPGHDGHGKAHLHMFFGNTSTNADSTTDSLINKGGGTCHGYETNRTAYWVPALLDKNNNARIPNSMIVYYKSMPEKSGSENINAAATEEMPQGLKMIASTEQPRAGVIAWQCYNGNGDTPSYSGSTIPTSCPPGVTLSQIVEFPPCWKGRDSGGQPILDSADHKSHMAYMMNTNGRWVCPSTHPVKLPRVSYHFYYNNEDYTDWHLSSDRHNGATYRNGESLHADWMGGWNQSAMTEWTNNCMKQKRNCSNGVMSDSKRLVNVMVNNGGDNIFGKEYPGPWAISIPAH